MSGSSSTTRTRSAVALWSVTSGSCLSRRGGVNSPSVTNTLRHRCTPWPEFARRALHFTRANELLRAMHYRPSILHPPVLSAPCAPSHHPPHEVPSVHPEVPPPRPAARPRVPPGTRVLPV